MASIRGKKLTLTVIKYISLCLIVVFFLFPYFIMLMRSFMSDNDVNFDFLIIPKHWSIIGYTRAFNLKTIYWIMNTVIIFVISALGIVLSSSLCAFGFSKLKFRGRDAIFSVVLATLMLPAISMQIPLYALYVRMNWVGTWFPLTLPGWFGGGAGTIFLMRQFMKGIPDSLCEAAKMDGANKLRIYFSIILPLCLPIIAYTVVNAFIGTWNDFQTPLMYLRNTESKYTISLGLYYTYKLTTNAYNYPNVQMAAGVVMTLPCIIIFFLFQRTLISGITMGAIKG